MRSPSVRHRARRCTPPRYPTSTAARDGGSSSAVRVVAEVTPSGATPLPDEICSTRVRRSSFWTGSASASGSQTVSSPIAGGGSQYGGTG